MLTDGRPEEQHAKIKTLDLEALFDEIVITDELGGAECRKSNNIDFVEPHKKIKISHKKKDYSNSISHYIAKKGFYFERKIVIPEMYEKTCGNEKRFS